MNDFTGPSARQRRGLHKDDLPLRLATARARERFRYLILRNNGMVAIASSHKFVTEDAARATGLQVLRRRSLAARLTPSERASD